MQYCVEQCDACPNCGGFAFKDDVCYLNEDFTGTPTGFQAADPGGGWRFYLNDRAAPCKAFRASGGAAGGGCADDPGGVLASAGMACQSLLADWGTCESVLDDDIGGPWSSGTSVAALCPATCGTCGQG